MSESALDHTITRPADASAQLVLDPHNKAGRRTKLAVTWQGKAIARDLGPHLADMSHADNLSGAADDLSLALEDRDDLWSGDWRPEYGDKVVVRIETTEAWFGSKTTSLQLGTFAYDKISIEGPPRRAVLQCGSAPLATGLRRRKRTKAWRGSNLKQIAKDIADRAGLSLDFQGDAGLAYGHAVQNNQSDLEFLQARCKELGRTLKITEGALVIYNEQTLESGASAGEIDLISGWVQGYKFDADDSGRYGSCVITFTDPRTGKQTKGQYPPDGVAVPGLDQNGQTLELSMSVSDGAQAVERAKAMLRNANRFAATGTISVVGDPGLVAGVIFDLTNAASLSGKFIITKATHRPIGGYTCTLSVRRCAEGY